MRKTIVIAAAIAILGGIATFSGTAHAQARKPAARGPHKVGLIDMAHVFKKYRKFEMLRKELKDDIDRKRAQAKPKMQRMKKLEDRLKSGELKEGSPDYLLLEKRLVSEAAKFSADGKVAQRDFVRRESQIYKQIYLEVTDAVQSYAEHYRYTLILRFNREGLDAAGNPQQVIKSMNRQVVYFRSNDDITEKILDYLNGQLPPERTTKKPSNGRRNRK